MKRPMAVVGIAYLAAQITAVAAGMAISIALCVVSSLFALAALILLSDKHRRMVLPVLVSFAVAFGAYSIFSAVKAEPSKQLYGQTVYIRGTVAQQPYRSNDRYYYIVDTDSIEGLGEVQKTTLRISSTVSLGAEVTDVFEGTVTVNDLSDDEGFGAVSSRLARGIMLTGYLPYGTTPGITEGRRGLPYFVSRMRYAVTGKIDLLLDGECAALLKGVLLGDKSDMSSAVVSDFRICGLSHLLAVSGMHMTILAAAVTLLLRRTGLNYRAVAGISIGFVWFFVLLTGCSYAVIRAAIMTTLMLLARVVKREADSLNSLGTALLVICLCNPYAAADVGLLLSAASTFGLIVLSPPVMAEVRRFIKGRIKDKYGLVTGAAEAVVSTCAATVCSMPVLMLCFGEYSLISPLANLMCLSLSNIFLVAGAAAVVLSFVPLVGAGLAKIIALAAWFSGEVMLFITRLLGDIPNASLPVNYKFLPVFFIGSAVLLLMWYLLYRRSERRIVWLGVCAAMLAVVFVSGVAAETIAKADDRNVTVYEVGDGAAVTFTSGSECIVIGTGGDRYDLWQMMNDLQDRNIARIDAVFYPSADEGCTSYAIDFIEAMEPGLVYMPAGNAAGDTLPYAVRKMSSGVGDIASACYESRSGRIQVSGYTDSEGKVWVLAHSGGMSVLVCPEEGNCALIPQTMASPDCAVIRSAEITNIALLSAQIVVISADSRECANAQALIRYRGIENVYTTAQGTVTVSQHGAGYIAGGE